jgi:hypothetical protein
MEYDYPFTAQNRSGAMGPGENLPNVGIDCLSTFRQTRAGSGPMKTSMPLVDVAAVVSLMALILDQDESLK